jgi:hypothetical protein
MRKFFTWPRRLANHQPDNFTPAPESGEWHEMFRKIPPASRRRGRPGSHTPLFPFVIFVVDAKMDFMQDF